MLPILIACVLCVGVLMFLVGNWRQKCGFAAGERNAKAQVEAAFDQDRSLRAGIADLGEENKRLNALLDAEKQRSRRYFETISSVCTERDNWLGLYNNQSIGHGNAQELMLSTIENLSRLLKANNIKHTIPRVLSEVRESYVEQHEAPARARVAAGNQVPQIAAAQKSPEAG